MSDLNSSSSLISAFQMSNANKYQGHSDGQLQLSWAANQTQTDKEDLLCKTISQPVDTHQSVEYL